MSKTDNSEPRDLDLWRRYSGGAQGPKDSGSLAGAGTEDSGELESLALAAYLDGTLSEAERSEIEARLAANPDDLQRALAARDALGDDHGPAPDAFVARACALVPEEVRPGTGLLRQVLARIAAPFAAPAPSWPPLAWSAAAVLVACTLGFQLGQIGYAGALSVERHLARDLGSVFGQSADDFL